MFSPSLSLFSRYSPSLYTYTQRRIRRISSFLSSFFFLIPIHVHNTLSKVARNELGSPPYETLLHQLQPGRREDAQSLIACVIALNDIPSIPISVLSSQLRIVLLLPFGCYFHFDKEQLLCFSAVILFSDSCQSHVFFIFFPCALLFTFSVSPYPRLLVFCALALQICRVGAASFFFSTPYSATGATTPASSSFFFRSSNNTTNSSTFCQCFCQCSSSS